MVRKGITAIGCFFIAIAAFLYAVKHITAAIMTAQINSPNVSYYGGGYQSIGGGITFWMVMSLMVGIVFFVIGILPVFREIAASKQRLTSNRENTVDN